MAQRSILSKRSLAYENLLSSLDADEDFHRPAFDNPTGLELDRE